MVLDTTDFAAGDRVGFVSHIDALKGEPRNLYSTGVVVAIYHGVGKVDVNVLSKQGATLYRVAKRPWDLEKVPGQQPST